MFGRQGWTWLVQLRSSPVEVAASVLPPRNDSLKTAMMCCLPTTPRQSLQKWW